jgi:hypothetical protein
LNFSFQPLTSIPEVPHGILSQNVPTSLLTGLCPVRSKKIIVSPVSHQSQNTKTAVMKKLSLISAFVIVLILVVGSSAHAQEESFVLKGWELAKGIIK